MPAEVDDNPVTETPRLRLVPASVIELSEIYSLHSDERVWRHRPQGRHPSIDYTRDKVVAMEQQWHRDSLGYWVARLRRPTRTLPTGTFVGVGGCAVEPHGDWWNLYYRVRPEAQGDGLATELARTAVKSALAANHQRPIVASLAEANEASRATAERAGLRLRWRGSASADPSSVQLVLADRPLDDAVLDAIIRA